MTDFEMVDTRINDRWTLRLPKYRGDRLWRTMMWEAERLDSMFENLRPGDLVYDIGADEGDLSALWALWGCEVVLVEPGPAVWANVKAVWAANGFPTPRATVCGFAADDDFAPDGDPVNVGAWPAAADGPLIDDHGFSVVLERREFARVRTDTLREKVGPPAAITMDVEGAELLVLRGAEAVLRNDKPLLWISVHPTFMAETFKEGVNYLWHFLRDCGYRWRLLHYDHELHTIAWHKSAPQPTLPLWVNSEKL